MVPEPVLCFDGDAAGRRAAFRAVETVLPHLKPGFSVQFAFLPDGLDPDDLVRQHGAAAFQAMLGSRTSPLFDVLIEREEQRSGRPSTPEQRASLEARLKALVARIADAACAHSTSASCARRCGPRTASWCGEIAGAERPPRRAALPASGATTPQLDWRVGGARARSARGWAACRAPPRRRRSRCGATSWPSARCRCRRARPC